MTKHSENDGVRVLVVDDEAELRSSFADLLATYGYRVSEAQHGKDALDVLATLPVALVVLDLAMPVMDGVQFLEVKRGDPRFSAIPVIVVSARRDPLVEDREDIVARFSKPCDVPRMLEVIRTTVGRR